MEDLIHYDLKHRIRISGPDLTEGMSEDDVAAWYDQLDKRIQNQLEQAELILTLLYPTLRVEIR